MRIFVGQMYTEVGSTFPFTIAFQAWLGKALSERVVAVESIQDQNLRDASLGFRINAKSDILQPVVYGPSIFKRDSTTEYTIVLPYDKKNNYTDHNVAVEVLKIIMYTIISILDELNIDTSILRRDQDVLHDQFVANFSEFVGTTRMNT